MGIQGLNWQTVQLPYAAGLDTKGDARASSPPSLDICKDVQFDEVGGLQTRKPFATMLNSIFGGGTISEARQLVENGDELLLFTKTALYSWGGKYSAWVLKGTHLAAKVDEEPRFGTTGDQIDSDRAELLNIVVYAWTDTGRVYVAARDATTDAVVMAPTALTGAGERPRLVALDTKILLFWHGGSVSAPGSLLATALDPANPAAGAATSNVVLASPDFNLYYDVTRIYGADTAIVGARRTTTTSYSLLKVTSALVVTASTKARTCDGSIAVSCDPTGTSVQVARANSTNIQGDLITISTLVDAFTAQAIGTAAATPVNQIAAAHRTVQNAGGYRCYVFWSAEEDDAAGGGSGWQSKSNWVDTLGVLGTQANFVRVAGIASRAFDYNKEIYVWVAFAGESGFSGSGVPGFRSQLQNTYFLYRDDGLLVAKGAMARAGGFSPSTGHLSGVATVGSSLTAFAWCGTERRVISLGENHSGYGARAPRDIIVTFDSNEARRCARIGQTLYITGGEILQYDGVQLVECGFHIYPWYFGAIQAAGGSVEDGVYALKVTERWSNARGELDRSTTATVGEVTVSGGPKKLQVSNWPGQYITHKTTNAIALEVWRTAKNPTDDSPFYLATSKDPSVTSNPNRYIANDVTAASQPTFEDGNADADATTKETNPENGGVLENLAPPAASIIAATDERLFLAGIAGDPDRVWYSKQRQDGEVASFHDALTVNVPRVGGDITAIAIEDGALIVWRETAIYAAPGDGLDNLGNGQNYGPVRIISTDCGAVSMESVARTPLGWIFKSSKGWYVLRGWSVEYIGGKVSDFDGDTVVAVHVVEAQHQIRCLTTSRMLVLDYLVNQWSEWTIPDGIHAAIWQSTYTYLTATAPKSESTTLTGLTYGWDVESAWIKPADLQGSVRVRGIMPLGEYRSPFIMRVRVARDYLADGAGNWRYFDDKVWTPSPTVIGSALQFKHGPSRQQCEAIKVRLTAYATLTAATFSTIATVPYAGFLVGGAVTTSGANWSATLTSLVNGTDGNGVTLSVYTSVGDDGIEVRDHESFDGSTWTADFNNIGVRVGTGTGTVLDLETAINAYSRLASVTTADIAPTKVITDTNVLHTGTFVFGAETYPTGEAAKLTGLGLEVGIKPGLNKRFAAAQRQ